MPAQEQCRQYDEGGLRPSLTTARHRRLHATPLFSWDDSDEFRESDRPCRTAPAGLPAPSGHRPSRADRPSAPVSRSLAQCPGPARRVIRPTIISYIARSLRGALSAPDDHRRDAAPAPLSSLPADPDTPDRQVRGARHVRTARMQEGAARTRTAPPCPNRQARRAPALARHKPRALGRTQLCAGAIITSCSAQTSASTRSGDPIPS